MRLVEKIGDAHFLIVHRVLEGGRGVRHLGDEQDEQEDVRDIELPGSPQYLSGGIERALAGEAAPINQGRREAGDEDEHFRRVEKGNCLQGEIAQDVLGNVVDKNQYQRHAAKEVETKITWRGRLGQGRLSSGSARLC